MAMKQFYRKRTKKKSFNANKICLVLNVDRNKCYIGYCRVPEQEKQMMLVK
jgi:hypothetical protein